MPKVKKEKLNAIFDKETGKLLQIDRKGYSVYFMEADDEQKINDLTSTGKVIGQVVYDSNKPGEQGNEVVIFVKSDTLENKD